MLSLKQTEQLEESLVTDVDGFVYFWPEGSNGHFPAWYLRVVADIMDERNKEWNDQINEYHKNETP